MRYHDHHLRGYTVSNFGADVVLDLLYRYPGQPDRESTVRVSGVRLHHFELTAPAILTSIEEVPVRDFVNVWSSRLKKWAVSQGLQDWTQDEQQLASAWEAAGLKAWEIGSAIGFSGFVVGAEMRSCVPNHAKCTDAPSLSRPLHGKGHAGPRRAERRER